MPRDKIQFQANVPETVALEFATGKLQQDGRFGDQYYYSLTGNRCMYVPPIVEQQIVKLGVQAGEEFTICKTERKEGRSKIVRWEVGLIGEAPSPAWDRLNAPAQAAPTSVIQNQMPSAAPPIMPIHALPTTPQQSRRQRMAELLTDCIGAVVDASAAAGRQFDGKEFQDLISTMVIDDQRRAETRSRYGGSLPPAQPRTNGHANGHGNGGAQWSQ